MKSMALDTTSLAWRALDETYATASVARCHVSWWSTSATDTSKRARTRSFSPLRTWRLPFSESTSGRCSSTIPSATRAATAPPRPLQRARDLFGREHLEHTAALDARHGIDADADRKSTRLNSSHLGISYAVFCLKKKKK